MADTRTDDEKARDCLKTLSFLELVRQPYEAMVDDILTYIHHGRRTIKDKGKQKGKKTGTDIYDGTALHAVNMAGDGLAGYSFSRSFRWFEYTLPGKLNFPKWSGMRAWSGKRMDEYPDVKEWLEACEEVMYAAFLRSNFYDVAPEKVKDCVSLGTVTALIEEDMENGRNVFTIPHFRECYIAENMYGEVDTLYRDYTMTMRQLVDRFGLDHLDEVSLGFKTNYEKNPHQDMEIVHAIYPRKDYDPNKKDSKNKPWVSLWLLKHRRTTDKHGKAMILEEKGYDNKPFITWRWRKNNDEWYGRSPCWDAFVDIMTANQMARTNLVAGHKMAEPPMIAPADLRGMVQTGPRGWTFIQGKVTKDNIPLPLQERIQLPFALEMQDRMDEKIREHLFVDFFLLLSQAAQENRNLTATQVIEMMGEKAAVLGPRIGHMESESANPIHDRMFAIERNAGRIPEPPEILLEYSGGDIEIDYMGPLSQAQKKLFKSQGINAGLESMAPLVAMFPEAVHVIKPYETAKILLESTGFPSKGTTSEAEFQEIVEGIKEQLAAQQALAEGTEIAKALPGAGKAIEEGSPLALLAEGEGA